METIKTLEIYAWIDRCLFPKDFEEDLIELGMDRMLAHMLISDLFRRDALNIVSCFQYFIGSTDKKWEDAQIKILVEFVDNQIKLYLSYPSQKRIGNEN